jgi:hypothetical protein
VAPNQPNPHKGVGKFWLIFSVLLLFLAIVSTVITSRQQIFQQSFTFQPLPNADGTQSVFSEPFQLQGRKNILISATAGVDNSWEYFEGDLINQDTGVVQPFSLPVEYYHGVDDGESWSEGGQTRTVYLSALPAGTYTMRLEGQWEHWEQEAPALTVKIEQGVAHGVYLIIALIFISVFPVLVFFRKAAFRRWKGRYVFGVVILAGRTLVFGLWSLVLGLS